MGGVGAGCTGSGGSEPKKGEKINPSVESKDHTHPRKEEEV